MFIVMSERQRPVYVQCSFHSLSLLNAQTSFLRTKQEFSKCREPYVEIALLRNDSVKAMKGISF